MSERRYVVQQLLKIGIALALLGAFWGMGVWYGDHRTQRWYSAHPVKECCFPVSYIDKDSVAPAGIGKPQSASSVTIEAPASPDIHEIVIRVGVECSQEVGGVTDCHLAHPLKLGKRATQNTIKMPDDCQDTKPQGDYPGHVDWTTCFDRETNKVRYQQRILTAPIKSKLGKRKPAPQVECPLSTAKEVEPTWTTNAHWQQYPLPPYWTCPAGYEQVTGNERFSASKPGEMASGSEDHAHKLKCELPNGTFGVPTPQVPQP